MSEVMITTPRTAQTYEGCRWWQMRLWHTSTAYTSKSWARLAVEVLALIIVVAFIRFLLRWLILAQSNIYRRFDSPSSLFFRHVVEWKLFFSSRWCPVVGRIWYLFKLERSVSVAASDVNCNGRRSHQLVASNSAGMARPWSTVETTARRIEECPVRSVC